MIIELNKTKENNKKIIKNYKTKSKKSFSDFPNKNIK